MLISTIEKKKTKMKMVLNKETMNVSLNPLNHLILS